MIATDRRHRLSEALAARDAYIALVTPRGGPLWHRIADPDARHALRDTACGLTLHGMVILTPWLPPAGELECGECKAVPR